MDEKPGSHPRVTFSNAINYESQFRCYPDAETAFDAAVTERPYNNTRLSFGYCAEDHDHEPEKG